LLDSLLQETPQNVGGRRKIAGDCSG